MNDIEALKHDKYSAAVCCVGMLQALLENGEIPKYQDERARQWIEKYMKAETALAIALDERCKANADRSGVKL